MSWLVFIIVAVLIFAAFAGEKRKQKNVISSQQTGLTYIKQVKRLIGLLQRHRGLSAALCQGDTAVLPDLNALKNEIKQITRQLNLTPDVMNADRWNGFKDHWSRLANHKENITTENSFKQHTHMLANVLYLLEDIAERHHLTQELLPDFKHVGFIWRELLAVTESVGQSRAIGTSAVTAKICSSVERIRLKFLRQHITHVSEKVLKSMNNSSDATLNKLIDKALNKTRYLTSAIVNEILDIDEIVMQRDDYFTLASETMDALSAIFEHQIIEIEKSLS